MNSLPHPDPDERFMIQAMELARLGKGHTAPNPCVGALLTIGDQIVARGFHQGPGHPHAEAAAIADARVNSIDTTQCTLWVTLEPCNHQGRTPPCTRAILDAGIQRVVVGTSDPNPHVRGNGAAFLREQGVEVFLGVAKMDCQDLIADFTTWMHTPRPYVYLKLACTLDGRIATRTGDSKWITGKPSRSMVHTLRSRVNAVLVGNETFLADNPRLTCRLAGETAGQSQPLALVAGNRLPAADADLFLMRERPEQTIFLTTRQAAATSQAEALRNLGCRVWDTGHDQVDLQAALVRLRSELGVFDVLCEGGGRLACQLVSLGLVGEWWLFQAPKTLGDEQAVSVLSGSVTELVSEARQWRFSTVTRVGEDILLVLRPVLGTEE